MSHYGRVLMDKVRVDFRRKSRSCENKKIGYPLYKKESSGTG